MAALCVPGRASKSARPKSARPRSLRFWLAAAGLFAVIAIAPAGRSLAEAPPRAPADAPIVTRLDQATLFKLPDRAATVIIGNPLIADVSVQAGIAVVTGKGYGATNVIVLDHSGTVLMEKEVIVSSPPDHVIYVYRGIARVTYSCDPDCSARVNLGDDPDTFDKILGQTVNRTTQAMTAGSSPAGGGK
jgi:Flp pilus assembly secretin CpaC